MSWAKVFNPDGKKTTNVPTETIQHITELALRRYFTSLVANANKYSSAEARYAAGSPVEKVTDELLRGRADSVHERAAQLKARYGHDKLPYFANFVTNFHAEYKSRYGADLYSLAPPNDNPVTKDDTAKEARAKRAEYNAKVKGHILDTMNGIIDDVAKDRIHDIGISDHKDKRLMRKEVDALTNIRENFTEAALQGIVNLRSDKTVKHGDTTFPAKESLGRVTGHMQQLANLPFGGSEDKPTKNAMETIDGIVKSSARVDHKYPAVISRTAGTHVRGIVQDHGENGINDIRATVKDIVSDLDPHINNITGKTTIQRGDSPAIRRDTGTGKTTRASASKDDSKGEKISLAHVKKVPGLSQESMTFLKEIAENKDKFFTDSNAKLTALLLTSADKTESAARSM